MVKIDPYNHERKYKEWRDSIPKEGIPNMSKANSDLTLNYLHDMEHGLNVSVSSVKGGRSYIRLNTLREKMRFFAMKFQSLYNCKLIDITEPQLLLFFSKMRKGEITRRDGKPYTSTSYFVKVFKAFWHWWQTVNRKQGTKIPDITVDLDSRSKKPKWVYLTEEQIKKLCRSAKFKYKVLIMFLFDTGIRAPTELVNIKISDLYNEGKELMIREETSKTFGRKIKLMICVELLQEYIEENELKGDDYLFPIKPSTVNKYLKRLATKVLGEENSLAGEKYSALTMYDFRHCSCCYWLPRYKSESALKYRFGWKKSDKIHYYSEMLGMKDTIQEDDMFVDITRTEIEQELERVKKDKEITDDRIKSAEERMDKFDEVMIKLEKFLERV